MIAVTGGAGFLGSHVVEALQSRGHDCVVVRSRDYDLRDASACERMHRDLCPSRVIHLAATCGGIGANMKEPGRFFFDNVSMGINVIDAARRHGVEQFILAGTVCAYPEVTPAPFREADLWAGYPEPTNAPYGVAKKSLFVMLDAYRRQYGLRSVVLVPTNLYGCRDNCDLATSHVIPAMARKFLSGASLGTEVTLWGTGAASRDFLHARDAATAFAIAIERDLCHETPINLGSGREVTMRSLAAIIASLCGYDTNRVVWDASYPDGQMRRVLDCSLAAEVLGWSPQVSLESGLAEVVEWIREVGRDQ
jgi:GDP-L-fucose synthase